MSQVNQLLTAEFENEQAIIAEEIRMEDLAQRWAIEDEWQSDCELGLFDDEFEDDLFREEDAGFLDTDHDVLATDDRWLEMYAFEHQEMRELSLGE